MLRALLSVALLAATLPQLALAQGEPTNLKFEIGEVGDLPPGWFVPTAGFDAKLTDKSAKEGKQCVRLGPAEDGAAAKPRDGEGGVGNIMQMIDARAYRGKHVRLKAAVKVEISKSAVKAEAARGAAAAGQLQMWLREDCAEQKMGFFDNMGDRPVTSSDWTEVEIVGDVSEKAERLNYGFMVFGGASAWIDDVSFEIAGESQALPVEAARELTPRGVENLVAFARLLGYVRFFHPSDAAAGADWDALAIKGVREVEGAKSAEELAAKLEGFFKSIAPTVMVFEASKRPKVEVVRPKPEAGNLEVTYWRHKGVGINPATKMVYSSVRERDGVGDTREKAETPNPDEPYFADLGGGAACLVPIAVYADEKGTLPRAVPAATAAPNAKPKYSGDDRATRLADVILAWNVFQHFFPYFDVVKTDWAAALPDGLKRAALDADERSFLTTLKWLGVQLHDGHVHVGHMSEPGTHAPAVRVGWIEDKLVVTVAGEDAGGLAPGTVIEKIDGKPAAEVFEAVMSRVSGATPQWIRHRAAVSVLVGAFDSEVKLEGKTPGGKAISATLKRNKSPFELKEKLPDALCQVRPGVWYVDIGRLESANLDNAAWAKLAAANGVVFDMRGYPSGPAFSILSHLTDKTITCARWNIPNQTRPDRTAMKFDFSNWPVPPMTPRLTNKVVFLTGGGAISAAETFMGIVENYKLAPIVGEATAGTNGNVNPLTLPGGYSISWTGMKVLKHDGSQHHGVGIQPTVPISRTVKGVAEGRDEVLERGIELVSTP
jgi:C-terminal processing protease CtpA/Prc